MTKAERITSRSSSISGLAKSLPCLKANEKHRYRIWSSRLISALLTSSRRLPSLAPMPCLGEHLIGADVRESPAAEVGEEVLIDATLDDGQRLLAVGRVVVDHRLRSLVERNVFTVPSVARCVRWTI